MLDGGKCLDACCISLFSDNDGVIYMYNGRHSGVVVSTVGSQQEGPRFETMGRPFCGFACSPPWLRHAVRVNW